MTLRQMPVEQGQNALEILSALLEGTGELIVAVSPDYRLLAMNAAFRNEVESLLGYQPEVGQSLSDLPSQPVLEASLGWHHSSDESKMLWSRALDGERFSVIRELEDPRWGRRVYEVNYLPLKNTATGELLGAASISRNITDRVNAEEQVVRLNHELNQRFQATYEQAAVGMVHVGADGRCLYHNRKLSDMLGYSDEELRTIPLIELTHPEDQPESLRMHEQTLLTGEVNDYTLEKRYIHKNGSIVWAVVTTSLIRDEAGQAAYNLALIRDISARKQAERAVEEAQALMETVSDAAPVGLWLSDPDNRCTFVNRYWLDFTGFTFEELRARGWASFVHPDDSARIYEEFQSYFKARKPCHIEYRVYRADGEVRWIYTRANPYYDPSGHFVGYVGSNVDITDRIEASRLIQERERQFGRIIETASEVIWQLDADYRIQFVNGQSYRLFGYFPEELTGRRVEDLIHPDSLLTYQQGVQRRKQGISEQLDLAFIRKDGETIWMLVNATPILDEEQRFIGGLAMMTDITQRKKSEQALLDSEQALRESESRLRKLVDTALMGVVFAHPDGRLEDANDAFLDMLGYTREELDSGQFLWTEATPPEWLEQDAVKWREIIELGQCTPLEKQFFHKDGHRVDALLAGALLDLPNPLCVAYVLDITERKRVENALRESEERYSRVVEGSNDGLWEWNLATQAVYWNRRCYEQLGLDTTQPVDFAFFMSLVHPDDLESAKRVIQDHVENDAPYELTFRLRHASGEYRWFYTRGKSLRDADGRAIQISGLRTDVTDIKQAERAVGESEERYRLVSQAANDIIWDWDLVNNVVNWNERAYRLLKYEVGEIALTPEWWYQSIHPEDRERVLKSIHRVIDGTESHWVDEYRFLRGDGQYMTMIDRGYLLRDESGRGLRMIGSMIDISDRKDYEVFLQRKVRQLELVSELGVRALTRMDINSLFEEAVELVTTTLSGHCAELMEYQPARNLLVSRVAYGFKTPWPKIEIPADESTYIGYAMRLNQPVQVHDIRQGNRFAISDCLEKEDVHSSLAAPIRGYRNDYGVLAVFSKDRSVFSEEDIYFVQSVANILGMTIERLRFEEMLLAYTRKLKISNDALEDFASIASHDMKEPLRKIKMFSTRLQANLEGPVEPEVVNSQKSRDYLDRIVRASDRMQGLIDDLLDYSRINTKARPFEMLDLNRLIADVLGDMQLLVEESGAAIAVEHLPNILADSSQMSQLFTNLIGNALKYRRMEVSPCIRISSTPVEEAGVLQQPSICIRIEDNGIGFDPLFKERIFRPFERLHGKSTYTGTGMGLAICQRVVERHGGTISATSVPGEGSCFTIVLPLVPPEPDI